MGEQREPISGRRLSTSEHSPQARQLVLRLLVQIFVNLAEPTTDPTSWICKAWQSRPPRETARPFLTPLVPPAGFRLGKWVAMLSVSRRQRITPAKCRCRGTDAFMSSAHATCSEAIYEVTDENVVEDIRRATASIVRRRPIWIDLEGQRGGDSIAELCRRS